MHEALMQVGKQVPLNLLFRQPRRVVDLWFAEQLIAKYERWAKNSTRYQERLGRYSLQYDSSWELLRRFHPERKRPEMPRLRVVK